VVSVCTKNGDGFFSMGSPVAYEMKPFFSGGIFHHPAGPAGPAMTWPWNIVDPMTGSHTGAVSCGWEWDSSLEFKGTSIFLVNVGNFRE
jgi:hypothetical protein